MFFSNISAMTIHYFAYGSNMSMDKLRGHAPSSIHLATGYLSRWQLGLNKKGHDGLGRATIHPEAGGKVWGVVYQMSHSDKEALDKVEGLGKGYREQEVEVVSVSGLVYHALTYVGIRLADNLHVADWYMKHIIDGAEENNLPAEYISKIKSYVTKT